MKYLKSCKKKHCMCVCLGSMKCLIPINDVWVSKMAQEVQLTARKPEDLSSDPGTHDRGELLSSSKGQMWHWFEWLQYGIWFLFRLLSWWQESYENQIRIWKEIFVFGTMKTYNLKRMSGKIISKKNFSADSNNSNLEKPSPSRYIFFNIERILCYSRQCLFLEIGYGS